MPTEDDYFTLFELFSVLKRSRIVFKSLMAAKRYFKIIFTKGIYLAISFQSY